MSLGGTARKERLTARQSKGKWSIRFEHVLALHVFIVHPLNFRFSLRFLRSFPLIIVNYFNWSYLIKFLLAKFCEDIS